MKSEIFAKNTPNLEPIKLISTTFFSNFQCYSLQDKALAVILVSNMSNLLVSHFFSASKCSLHFPTQVLAFFIYFLCAVF